MHVSLVLWRATHNISDTFWKRRRQEVGARIAFYSSWTKREKNEEENTCLARWWWVKELFVVSYDEFRSIWWGSNSKFLLVVNLKESIYPWAILKCAICYCLEHIFMFPFHLKLRTKKLESFLTTWTIGNRLKQMETGRNKWKPCTSQEEVLIMFGTWLKQMETLYKKSSSSLETERNRWKPWTSLDHVWKLIETDKISV